MSAPIFPGGVAVSDLVVYEWEAADGRCGGSPHLHTASSEGYVVTAGVGSVETVSADGVAEHELTPGEVLWFSPGTVHRLVNHGGLRLLVIMQNAGLPEAGDAVLTFPAHVLEDPASYAAAATLPEGPGRESAARARRDLAMEGYLALREDVAARGPAALADLHVHAARLVRPRVADWRDRWERTALAEVEATRRRLDDLEAGLPDALGTASVARAEPVPGDRAFGMCGRLATWHF